MIKLLLITEANYVNLRLQASCWLQQGLKLACAAFAYLLLAYSAVPLEVKAMLCIVLQQKQNASLKQIQALYGTFQLQSDGRCVWRRQTYQVKRVRLLTAFCILIELQGDETKIHRLPLMRDAMDNEDFRHLSRICLSIPNHIKS